MKQIFILLVFVILLCGCTGNFKEIIIDDSLYQTAPRDPLTFNDVQLKKNILKFNMSYGGGCEEHEFQLFATSFMESYPVQVNILLSHEDNNDPCDMWLTETLIFNILPLKNSYNELYEESGTIIINIQGWEDPINYNF